MRVLNESTRRSHAVNGVFYWVWVANLLPSTQMRERPLLTAATEGIRAAVAAIAY